MHTLSQERSPWIRCLISDVLRSWNSNEPRSGVQIIAQGVRGCCPTYESQLPSSAEEGKADAVAAAGVVLVKKIIILISTTPSARAKVASQLFLCRAATPPRLRRGAAVRTLGNSPEGPTS